MNFDEAIKAHAAWKSRLLSYLGNPDHSIDVERLEKDNACALGRWIYTGAKAYTADPGFWELKREHALFHKEAAALVRRANSGEKVCQEAALGAASSYAQHSSKVITLILGMKRKTAGRH